MLTSQLPDPNEKLKGNYLKGLSTNKFKNFKAVMEDLHERKMTTSQSLTHHNQHAGSCTRTSCLDKASTFYMGG